MSAKSCTGCMNRAAEDGRTVNNVGLVTFRMMFGLLMAAESFGAIATGWVYRAYVEPRLTFSILPFDWPKPLPGGGMYGYFIVMGLSALAVMAGWRYRWTSVALALLWTGAYLTQKTHYNNHYYLAVLLCWAMTMVPAHRRAALDVGRTGQRSESCPAWLVFAFKLQVLIVFVFAAIAKLYPGWWNGDYIAVAFGMRSERFLVGPLLTEPAFQQLITYSGIAFDALVIPALWWSRTRLLAFGGLIVFNLFNSLVFQIGVFPYLVLALSVFFFYPSTVESVFRWVPGLGRAGVGATSDVHAPIPWPKGALGIALGVYFALQVGLPLRHHLIEGNVNWTDEGHRMAWRMMLRHKSGQVTLVARDPKSGQQWVIDQKEWLTRKQRQRIATRPDFMFQFVQALKTDFADQGVSDIQIFARNSRVRLNKGPEGPLFDGAVDLARAAYHPFGHCPWVIDGPPAARE